MKPYAASGSRAGSVGRASYSLFLSVARDERGRVHSRQATRRHVTNDDCLHSLDPVHADDFGACHDPELTASRHAAVLRRHSPKASRCSRVGRTQDDENALGRAAGRWQRPRARRCRRRDDEIDRPRSLRAPRSSRFADSDGTAQRPQERFELSQLDRFQPQRPQFAVAVAAAGARL